MISGGAALSGDLLFAPFLAAFGAFASLSMSIGVVDQATPAASDDVPVRPVVRQLAKGSVAALLGAAAFFILFPRLSWNVANHRVGRGILNPTAGLGETIDLSKGGANIKSSPRIVARAQLRPDPQKARLDRYWVARTYSHYSGRGWVGQATSKKLNARVSLRPASDKVIRQQIELLPSYGSRTALALEPPVFFGNASAHLPYSTVRTSLLWLEGQEVQFQENAQSFTYSAYSDPTDEVPEEPLQVEEAPLLQLPERVDPRIAELARKVAGNERQPLAVARKLEGYLKSTYGYTLELPDANVPDPLAHFLFERKLGHCEYFATALTVMLRTLGIPSRVAVGFYGGERVNTHYVLRAGDAHAWTHVYVPERGFVTFDATPEDFRSASSAALMTWLTELYEAIDSRWRSAVVDYSFRDQAGALRRFFREDGRSSMRLPPLREHVPKLAALLLAIVVARRLLRLRPERGPTALLTAAERALLEAGVSHPAGEELEELSARLTESAHPLASPVSNLRRRYLEARFGHVPLRSGEARELLGALHASIAAEAQRQAQAEAQRPHA
jgi:transglutaminase-like putative cysteine protease